jgi:ABC-type nickel/cobalt efflux system permease component RcnA
MLWQTSIEQLVAFQRWIYGALSADLAAFAATRDWTALAAVMPTGAFFGAVHALTPGHGKSILASYLVGSRLAALRAIVVAAVLALTHVGSAVLLALITAPLITRTLGGVGRAPALELASRGLLVFIGLWLILRAWRARPHPHGEGLAVGFVAGLVPCPLTLFAMFFTLARGVPEAGLAFAVAMMVGVLTTLAIVAFLTVLTRDWLIDYTARHGASILRLTRALDAASNALLIGLSLHDLAH